MSEIIMFSQDQLRDFAKRVAKQFEQNQRTALPFDVWEATAFPKLMKTEGAKYPMEVRVAPTAKELLETIKEHSAELDEIEKLPEAKREAAKLKLFKQILLPKYTFTLDEPILDERTKVPIWFGSTLKSAKILVGFKDGNRDTPFYFELGDDFVHGKMSGGTGSGKSVTMHTLVSNLILYYAPWEVQIFLADFKLVELSKYAVPVPCPHVQAIIGSENTSLASSVFKAFVGEMNDRSALFQMVGVSSLKDFRKRFNMVMPRCILLVDEFAQLFTNLKKAADYGSSTAADEKTEINNAIGEVARLGRSMGNHMILSSQSLVGLLEEQTDKQFAGGIALKVNTPDDSNAVIGNPDAAYITAKGRGYVNLNRAAKDSALNNLVQIPLIDCELSDADQLAGRQTYVTETISMLKEKSDSYGTSRDLFYYNDNAMDSISKFYGDVEMAKKRFVDTPYDSSTKEGKIRSDIYRESTAICLTLGRGITYSKVPQYFLDLPRKQGANIIISGRSEAYILKLLAQNFKYYRDTGTSISHVVVPGNKVSYKMSELDSLLNIGAKGNIEMPETKIPIKQYSKIDGRELISTLSNLMKMDNAQEIGTIMPGTKIYNIDTAMNFVCGQAEIKSLAKKGPFTADDLPKFRDFMIDIIKSGKTEITTEAIKAYSDSKGYSYKEDLLTSLATVLVKMVGQYKTFNALTKCERYVTANDFPLTVIWLLGLDTFNEIVEKDRDKQQALIPYLMKGPKYNVYTILTATQWDRLFSISENANFVIEREAKQFFQAINMPCSINIYDKTFQIHNREDKSKVLIKEFKLD